MLLCIVEAIGNFRLFFFLNMIESLLVMKYYFHLQKQWTRQRRNLKTCTGNSSIVKSISGLLFQNTRSFVPLTTGEHSFILQQKHLQLVEIVIIITKRKGKRACIPSSRYITEQYGNNALDGCVCVIFGKLLVTTLFSIQFW